jgi:hypothetical protein
MREKFLQGLNLALTINLFFVLFCFFWLAIAVLGRGAGISLGLDTWYKLWVPVMQPAIGILMVGAILSGVSSWVSKRLNSKNP